MRAHLFRQATRGDTPGPDQDALGDFMAGVGGCKGETPEEILRILRETRAAGSEH